MSLILPIIIISSIVFLLHSILNLISMLFSWNDPYTHHLRKSPKKYSRPQTTFSLLVPVRNEPNVIGDTLIAMAHLKYPQTHYEVIVICREDDSETLAVVGKTISRLQQENIRLEIVGSDTNNKPKALNIGLQVSSKDVLAVFDAEDEPHPDILNVINTLFLSAKYDVIQSGVQLMNYQSNWFAPFNVLEYYFWFKSSLHFFAWMKVVPLGGNTVFIRKNKLRDVKGWDEKMLTEDADLGIRLSIRGANIGIVYDEEHATREEVPISISQFVKQRTRWNQGFLQILVSLKWLQLPDFRSRLFTCYLLLMPLLQALWIVYLPLTLAATFLLSIPVGWAMLSLMPAYLLFIQLFLYCYGMFLFTREYELPWLWRLLPMLVLTFFPYQLVLSFAAARAFFRLLFGQMTWEKTTHLNVHRIPTNE